MEQHDLNITLKIIPLFRANGKGIVDARKNVRKEVQALVLRLWSEVSKIEILDIEITKAENGE